MYIQHNFNSQLPLKIQNLIGFIEYGLEELRIGSEIRGL